MANTSRPFGFRPTRYPNGSPYNGAHNIYAFSASQANNAYVGDLVQIDTANRSTGVSDVYVPGVPLVKPVVAALTTNAYRGVIVGFVPQPEFSMSATASLGTMYRPASTTGYVMVVDDMDVSMEAEETGNTYTSASNNAINKVIDIAYTAGSQLTGISAVVVDAATVSVAAVKPFRVLRYTQRVDNFNFTASDTNSRAHLDLMINNSDLFPANQLGA